MSSRQLEFMGRDLTLELSPAAERALQGLTQPITAEMELYFSCLIRKKVRFHSDRNENDVAADEHLNLRFRPVMTRHCEMDGVDGEPPLTDFPIANVKPYVPHWLKVDFQDGQWRGEFGYNPAA